MGGTQASGVLGNATLAELSDEEIALWDEKLKFATAAIEASVASGGSDNSTLSASWWGWHHGVFGETCCMCSSWAGHTTVLYSAADYHHWYGSHNAKWQCLHDCPSKCASNWHHGRYFGCYDEQHLKEMDRLYGHRDHYTLAYGHFGNLCQMFWGTFAMSSRFCRSIL